MVVIYSPTGLKQTVPPFSIACIYSQSTRTCRRPFCTNSNSDEKERNKPNSVFQSDCNESGGYRAFCLQCQLRDCLKSGISGANAKPSQIDRQSRIKRIVKNQINYITRNDRGATACETNGLSIRLLTKLSKPMFCCGKLLFSIYLIGPDVSRRGSCPSHHFVIRSQVGTPGVHLLRQVEALARHSNIKKGVRNRIVTQARDRHSRYLIRHECVVNIE